MNLYAHISCGFEALLSVNGGFAGEVCPASPAVHAEFGETERLFITAYPLKIEEDAGIKLLPVSCALSFAGGKPMIGGGRAAVTVLPRRHFEVFIPSERVYGYFPPVPLAQKEFTLNGVRHTVTVFRDALNQAVCEGGGRLYTHVLPLSYRHGEITAEPIRGGCMIRIGGAAGARGEKRYLAVFLFTGEYRLTLNLLADEMETEGGGIHALCRRADIAKRGEVSSYIFDGELNRFKLNERYLVYMKNAPVKPAHPRITPYALFEAVKAGDFEEARSFLSEGLNGALTEDGALYGFFADYREMSENKYYPDIENSVLIKGAGKADILELEYAGDKIDNFKIV
jgi:hypothetical protein